MLIQARTASVVAGSASQPYQRHKNAAAAFCLALAVCLVCILSGSASAQTSTNAVQTNTALVRAEQIRSACVQGRRYVCGRVLQILPEGLVVDSGYADLLKRPFNKSWVVNGTATVTRDSRAVEENEPDAMCVGVVFLTGTPKNPKVNPYDYVVTHAYPAGEYKYSPVPGVEKTVRRFSASLDRAIKLNLESAPGPSAGQKNP